MCKFILNVKIINLYCLGLLKRISISSYLACFNDFVCFCIETTTYVNIYWLKYKNLDICLSQKNITSMAHEIIVLFHSLQN